MLSVIRSFSLQNRIIAFVSASELTRRFSVGVTLTDDVGQLFVLTGIANPRSDKQHEVAVVLRSTDGRRVEPTGHLRLIE